MVDQLITQFIFKARIERQPKIFKQKLVKKINIFAFCFAKQSSTPGLPSERIAAYPFFQKTNMGSSPNLMATYPFTWLHGHSGWWNGSEPSTCLSRSPKKGQWSKAAEYTHRAQTFVAAAYLCSRQSPRWLWTNSAATIEDQPYFLSVVICSKAFETMSQSTPEYISTIIAGTSILSLVLALQSYIQRNHIDSLSRTTIPSDRIKKSSFNHFQKRLRSWLPRFIQNRLHHQLSQKAISYYWYHLREYMTYSHIPGIKVGMIQPMKIFFQKVEAEFMDSHKMTFYAGSAKRCCGLVLPSFRETHNASPQQIKIFQCSDIFHCKIHSGLLHSIKKKAGGSDADFGDSSAKKGDLRSKYFCKIGSKIPQVAPPAPLQIASRKKQWVDIQNELHFEPWIQPATKSLHP